jgi:1-acyl-sn-glycerol-3-phosphate acyltransferase
MESTNKELSFDAIRPFRDDEVPRAMDRLLNQPSFHTAMRYVFPDTSTSALISKLKTIKSVDQFQEEIIANAVNAIIRSTTNGVRTSGLEHLNPKTPYLFISNHRDIVLDSAVLNYMLLIEEFPTTRIAIGSNLLQMPWIEDLAKLNKNFIVHRDVHAKQAYEYSLRLSAFIRHSIEVEKVSVWIAQKEGRTKNGADRTQAGLLKMFAMGEENDIVQAYASLNIVPVSIAYEIEPCGGLKAKELFTKAREGKYMKEAGEDLLSMKNGIARPKGRVKYVFDKPLTYEEIEPSFQQGSRNECLKHLAEVLDQRIIKNYRLYPYNYLAYDLLNGNNDMQSHYKKADIDAFKLILKDELNPLTEDQKDTEPYLIQIYANPINRKIELNLPI